MNKNQKEINTLLNQSMTNLQINFEKEKCNIKYEEYKFGPKSILWNISNISKFNLKYT